MCYNESKAGCYHKEFYCIVNSGDECSSYSSSFIVPIFDIAIFKVQSAEIHAGIYEKLLQ